MLEDLLKSVGEQLMKTKGKELYCVCIWLNKLELKKTNETNIHRV